MAGFEFVKVDNGAPLKMWNRGVPFEDKAIQQAKNAASLPFVKGVSLMPDCHTGIGATIGSVVATKGVIVPSMVGVDIGCGMAAVRTNLRANQLPDNLAPLRSKLEAAIPHGRTDNGGDNDRGAWHNPPAMADIAFDDLASGLKTICDKHEKLQRPGRRAYRHMGTLGTGNHFVEICLDTEQRVWVMLHSGSRGIGNAIGSYFIEKAKEEMKRWHIHLPDMDLAYLPEGSQYFADYVEAVGWAQNYARANRQVMMQIVLCNLGMELGIPIETDEHAINCHHNYVEKENHFGSNVWLTRKGAVRARRGDLGIIPGSMGAKSFIVEGKGNPDSFCSCSHGAGRAMGRKEAERRFTLEDHAVATAGVECRKDASVLDETPGAYKNIDDVMAAQSDLITIKYTLKQILCIKG